MVELSSLCEEPSLGLDLSLPENISNTNLRGVVMEALDLREQELSNPKYRRSNYSEAYQGERA